jgi:hypothetical protein
VSLDISMEIGGYIWFVLDIFNIVSGEEEGNTMGYGVKILKVNEDNVWTVRTLQRKKAK